MDRSNHAREARNHRGVPEIYLHVLRLPPDQRPQLPQQNEDNDTEDDSNVIVVDTNGVAHVVSDAPVIIVNTDGVAHAIINVSDVDTVANVDADADADGNTDINADADADVDADADTDAEAVVDTNADADVDVDVDVDE
mmetsp:Transcript_42546/g.43309  ORF Transcript_42546/g.43309 Transcript_42546/m.43309 type:complete len:139 (-) Transcript_42546:211-627(-)